MLFAANRVGWAALLVGVKEHYVEDGSRSGGAPSPEHPVAFDTLADNAAFLSNKLGSCVFYALTALLLTKVRARAPRTS